MTLHFGKGRSWGHQNRKTQGVSSAAAPANTRNWSAANLPNTVAGLARVRANTDDMLFAYIGDSRFSAVGATRAESPSVVMAAALATSWGVPVSTNSCFGAGTSSGTASVITAFDPRITFTGTPVASFNSFGGFAFKLSAAGQKIDYAVGQADSIDAFWSTFSGNGTFNLYVDGVLAGANPIDTNVAASVVKRSITGLADTTHTLRAEWVSGNVTFNGWIGKRSTVKAVHFVNGGCPGLKADDWNTNGSGIAPRTVLAAVAASFAHGASVVAFNCITNDENANASPATAFNTQYAGVATYIKTTLAADMISVVAAWEGVTGSVTAAVQENYRQAILAISDSTTTPCYDLRNRWPDWVTMNGLGLFSSTIHEKNLGYSTEYGTSPGVAGALAAIVA